MFQMQKDGLAAGWFVFTQSQWPPSTQVEHRKKKNA
jgi:hypothetical protein